MKRWHSVRGLPPEAANDRDILDTIIIGAGISGLCVARRLHRGGHFSYLVLEQADDVGGTWRDNTYPGCGCDIPSPLYSYSFAQRADWTRLFARQPEIHDYLQRFARRSGVRDHIQFGTKVLSAIWQEREQTWLIKTATGRAFQSRFLISAIGALHIARHPDIPGRQAFSGTAMHSSRWDHTVDLRGKRVAVIGTGASAVQFIPQIASDVEHLDVFQRTPSWIVPKADRAFTTRQQRLRKLGLYRWYSRARLFWIHESRVKGFTEASSDMAATARLARSHLARQIKEPQLRAALTPDYAVGCKRLLISSDYYPALARDNVSLQTSPITAMTPEGVTTADGRSHRADVVIYATGFDAQSGFADVDVVGRDGRRLAERWRQGRQAYLATTVAGFPNYFVMTGPNSGLGHNSQIFMIEAQTRYIASCLRIAHRRRIGSLDVKQSVETRFNMWLQERLAQSVWQTGGCTSWYQHPASGRNTVLWPSSTIAFWWRTHRAHLSDYDATPFTQGRFDVGPVARRKAESRN